MSQVTGIRTQKLLMHTIRWRNCVHH